MKLPKPKKSLKSFILEEDAKVIDKAMTKITLTTSFIAMSMAFNSDDVNAKGHHNHSNHKNYIFHEGDYQQTSGSVIHDDNFGNDGSEPYSRTFSDSGTTVNIEVNPKEVVSTHANHYNHANGGGKS